MTTTLLEPGGTDVRDRFDRQTLRVEQMRWEAQSVVSIELVRPDGGELPAWTPGAHIDVFLPSGLIRQYSLCGDPADRHAYRIAVLREQRGRGGSAEVHDSVLIGRSLEIRGPRNHFALKPADDYLFLAGGIGVTPILAMAREAARSGLGWMLYYGGRDRAHMAFQAELTALDADRVRLLPQDEVGLPDLDAIVGATSPATQVYCCGPEGMIRAVEETCKRLGRSLTIERFTGAAPAPADAEPVDATEFEVELRRTGVTVRVPADRTLLAVIQDVLPDVPSSCEEGYCGACETRVLDGVPEHHDQILDEQDRASNTTMMVCVGRARSQRLVLDL
ncbi:PDR/VanB family oxidoreductase [Phytohabitans flavus]|uniref:Ferredoxin n=1 Tax=Phytohabitans flavus TaxID=1076124 RepID=A0A6F8XVX9_9ACTN|nr:PDR/VanB family oxidoreductase [Phytohabitans flavus]BCB77891.1 ferredoxin [Phytohabitans flavus]